MYTCKMSDQYVLTFSRSTENFNISSAWHIHTVALSSVSNTCTCTSGRRWRSLPAISAEVADSEEYGADYGEREFMIFPNSIQGQ